MRQKLFSMILCVMFVAGFSLSGNAHKVNPRGDCSLVCGGVTYSCAGCQSSQGPNGCEQISCADGTVRQCDGCGGGGGV